MKKKLLKNLIFVKKKLDSILLNFQKKTTLKLKSRQLVVVRTKFLLVSSFYAKKYYLKILIIIQILLFSYSSCIIS